MYVVMCTIKLSRNRIMRRSYTRRLTCLRHFFGQIGYNNFKKNNMHYAYNLPGHLFMLQIVFSIGLPEHVRPPSEGVGFEHDRERVWLPPLHVAEHIVQSDQLLQSPSTLKIVYKRIKNVAKTINQFYYYYYVESCRYCQWCLKFIINSTFVSSTCHY